MYYKSKEPFLLEVPHIKNELLSFKEIYKNNSHILEGKRGINNSNPEFKKKYQFSRFIKIVKNLILLKMAKKKSEDPFIMKNSMSDSNSSYIPKSSEKNYGEPNLDEKSFENLIKYISKLDRMQKEKE